MYIFLAFAFGCTLTYLITILSSAIRSSEILENAMLTYALLMMSAFEVSVQQLENTIVRSRIEVLNGMSNYIGSIFSKEYVQKEILMLTDEEISAMESQIAAEPSMDDEDNAQ